MDSKRYLVTGAGGFVGGNLVTHLVNQGHKVIGLVRTPGQAEKVRSLGGETVQGDLLNPESLNAATSGCDGVFHIAALFRQANQPKNKYFEVNVDGTRNVLDACIKNNVPKFIHCSTVGVHGHIQNPPADEDYPFSPGDYYQESKAAGENLVSEYFKSGKIDGSIIRPAMIWGPRDERIFKLFKMVATRKFFFVGSGKINLHFVDVRDLAAGFLQAMESTKSSGRTYILSGSSPISLNQLISVISALLGVPEPKIRVPAIPLQILGAIVEGICIPFRINPPIYRRRVDFFTKQRWFNSERAQKEIGFSPKQDLVHEAIDIIRSYLENGWLQIPAEKLPSVMLRSLDGEIKEWDPMAEELYGWSRLHAVGAVSHSLLKTGFPDELERINQSLLTSKHWSGPLRHKTREGQDIKVQSRWNLVPKAGSNSPIVLETNLPTSSWAATTREKVNSSILSAGMTFENLLPLIGELSPSVATVL